jgi:uncharacterized repeat protein (TIGR01451 family)
VRRDYRWAVLCAAGLSFTDRLDAQPNPAEPAPLVPPGQTTPIWALPALRRAAPEAEPPPSSNAIIPVVVPTQADPPAAPPVPELARPPVRPVEAAPEPPRLNFRPAEAAPAAPAPCVLLDTVVPEQVNIGQVVPLEIVVRNPGATPLFQVRVESELPSGWLFLRGTPEPQQPGDKLIWSIGILDAGAQKSIRFEVKPTVEGDLRGRTTASFVASREWRTKTARPKLGVTINGPETARVGEPVAFEILVTNFGTGTTGKMTMRGRLPDGLQHPQGPFIEADLPELPPGASKSITLRTVAKQNGPQTVEMSVSDDGGLEVSAKGMVRVAEPVLLLKQNSISRCQVRNEVGYELQVSNPGTTATASVQVHEQLPQGLEFVSASDGGRYDPVTRAVAWEVQPLDPGTQQCLTLKCKASQVGEWMVPAVARDGRGLEAKSESRLQVQGIPALAFEVIDQNDPIEVGGVTTYEIRVLNQGTCPCTNVQLAAYVPEGMIARDANGATGYTIRGRQVVFEPLPKLAVKSDVLYRIRVQAASPGDMRFKAQLSCDQLAQPVVKEESTRVYRE